MCEKLVEFHPVTLLIFKENIFHSLVHFFVPKYLNVAFTRNSYVWQMSKLVFKCSAFLVKKIKKSRQNRLLHWENDLKLLLTYDIFQPDLGVFLGSFEKVKQVNYWFRVD
jgi:hypothetical protein